MRTVWTILLALALMTGVACFPDDVNNVGGSDTSNGTGGFVPDGAGVDGACNIDADCRTGLACEGSACQPSGETAEGSPCSLSEECAEGLYCNLFLGSTCSPAGDAGVNDACGGTQDCQQGLVCAPRGFSGVCVEDGEGDLFASCDSIYDCRAGLTCSESPTSGEKECLSALTGWRPRFWEGVQCEGDGQSTEGDLRAYFEVDPGEFYRLPFPNDIRLNEGGHPVLTGHPSPGDELLGFDLVRRYMDTIEQEQDHYGLNQGVFLRFSGRLDLDSVQARAEGRNVMIVNIDAESNEYQRRHSLYWQAATLGNKYICHNWMMVRPAWGSPLRPRTTYAVVLLKNGIAGEDGEAIARDGDFEAVMGGQDPGGNLSAAWDVYAPLRSWAAEDEEVTPDDILVAAVFTTGDPRKIARTLREAVRNEPAPAVSDLTLCEEGVTSPCDDGLEGDDHTRGCFGAGNGFSEIQGRIGLPILQKGTAPYEVEGGGLDLAGGVPRVQRTEDVCMAMTVPDGEMPAEGWPVLIYAHGTGGTNRSHVGQVSGLLSNVDVGGGSTGFLVVGWDQVQHFTRRGDSEIDPEGLVYNFTNPIGAQGNFYQGAADIHAMVAWLESLEIPADQSPTGVAIKADPNQIYFMGHSQGGGSGPLMLPYEPGIRGAVLSGAGGGLLLSLLGKTSPVNIPEGVALALQEINLSTGESRVSEAHPVLNIVQGFFDPIDPVNYAEYLSSNVIEGETTPMHVFHTIGLGDTYTPPDTLAVMATAMRIDGVTPLEEPDLPRLFYQDTVAPPAGGNRTILGETYTALGRQYAPDGYDGHFVIFRNAKAQQDLAEFLGSAVLEDFPQLRD